jgi:hypothetical protein
MLNAANLAEHCMLPFEHLMTRMDQERRYLGEALATLSPIGGESRSG